MIKSKLKTYFSPVTIQAFIATTREDSLVCIKQSTNFVVGFLLLLLFCFVFVVCIFLMTKTSKNNVFGEIPIELFIRVVVVFFFLVAWAKQ